LPVRALPYSPGERREILLDSLPQCKPGWPIMAKNRDRIPYLFFLFYQWLENTALADPVDDRGSQHSRARIG